ncbi:hypothetical protein ACWC2H_21140 [Streptomyces sp. 900105755]
MHVNKSATLCVVSGGSSARRLVGAEAAVIVVVIVVAAALRAVGMKPMEVMRLMGAAGLLSVVVTQLATGAVSRGLRHLARAQPTLLLG